MFLIIFFQGILFILFVLLSYFLFLFIIYLLDYIDFKNQYIELFLSLSLVIIFILLYSYFSMRFLGGIL